MSKASPIKTGHPVFENSFQKKTDFHSGQQQVHLKSHPGAKTIVPDRWWYE